MIGHGSVLDTFMNGRKATIGNEVTCEMVM
jgi:hypothetical protein